MQVTTLDRRLAGPVAGRPLWPRITVSVAAIVAAVAILLATAAINQPGAAGLESAMGSYPFLVGPLGLVVAVCGAVVAGRQPSNAWSGIVSLAGILLAVNAALIAGETYAATSFGSHEMRAALGWIERWAFIPTDLATLTWLLLLYPSARVSRPFVPVVGLLGAAQLLLVLIAMFGPGRLDGTAFENPVGFLPLPPDTHEALFPIVMLAGAAACVVRLLSLALSRSLVTAAVGVAAFAALAAGVTSHRVVTGSALLETGLLMGGYLACAAIATAGVITNHREVR